MFHVEQDLLNSSSPSPKRKVVYCNGPDLWAFAGSCDFRAQVSVLPQSPMSPGDCKLRLYLALRIVEMKN